jgi:ethanolamine permease
MSCLGTLVVTALWILFATCAQYPGVQEISDAQSPLNYGYRTALGLSDRQATWLVIPGTYATAFGFMYSFNRQLSAMSESGLLPKCLSQKAGVNHTSYVSIVAGSVAAFVVMRVVFYVDASKEGVLFLLSICGSYVVYGSVFVSYIVCQSKYSSVKREFRSPLGVAGAYYGLFVFAVSYVGVVVFQEDGYIAFACFLGFMGLCAAYYVLVARQRQVFSEEEQKALFTAYVINCKSLPVLTPSHI